MAPPRTASPAAIGEHVTVGVDHVVEAGQTLWRIARAYGVTIDDLIRVNEIDDPTRVEAGRTLFIPGALTPLRVPAAPAPPPAGAAAELRSLGAERALEAPDGDLWIWPVSSGRLLSGFGAPRRSRRHLGLDIAGRSGQAVLAARPGVVIYSGNSMRGYGETVIVDHGDGTSSLYAHNSDLLVTEGARVARGQTIARIGRTGNATTPHCHFEIRVEGRPVDPVPHLPPTLEARR